MAEPLLYGRFEWILRLAAAQGLTLLLLVLGLISFSLPYSGEVRPFFLLMAVYYWAIYRPTLMPSAFVFVLGLTIDLISGVPPGLNTVILLLVQWLVRDQRLYLMGQPFIMVWLGFCMVCSLVLIGQWGVMSVVHGAFLSLMPIVTSGILTIFLFPLVALFLNLTHRLMPDAPGHSHHGFK